MSVQKTVEDFMAPWQDKVNWPAVEQMTKEYGLGAHCIPFGWNINRTVTDTVNTAFATDDVIVQPRWTEVPDKIIVSTTITGAFYNKKSNPNHPVSMEEIYAAAREVCLAGAPVLHVHVRNDEGLNVLDPKRLKYIFNKIKDEFPDVCLDCCLVPMNPAAWDDFQEMMESGLIESSPVNTCATYCGDMLLVKYPHVMIQKAKALRENGVRARLAVYCDGDIDNADRYLIKTGLVPTAKDGLPTYWGVLPALPGGSPMNNVNSMVEGFMRMRNRILDIDPGAIIQVCASGRASTYLATMAILTGCHLRVGMEDTVWHWPHKDDKIVSNGECFKQYKELCSLLGREVMTSAEYRKFLGLREKK